MNIIASDLESRKKFSDPQHTLDGQRRAQVPFQSLDTLWLNTGTLCNLACENCYIESSPSNNRLLYLSRLDVQGYLTEIETKNMSTRQIGITGGEPFMNPSIIEIIEDCLNAGYCVLILTNAMRPMMKQADRLLALHQAYPTRLAIRVSIDHYDWAVHESERGPRSWQPMVRGLQWLHEHEFLLQVAGRLRWTHSEPEMREGFGHLFGTLRVAIDASDPDQLILFPEMDPSAVVPEITQACWATLNVEPQGLMCASSRMIVKRMGVDHPEVIACTLLPYDPNFSLGTRLSDSFEPVSLNHVHCAKFCILGGGSCTG